MKKVIKFILPLLVIIGGIVLGVKITSYNTEEDSINNSENSINTTYSEENSVSNFIQNESVIEESNVIEENDNNEIEENVVENTSVNNDVNTANTKVEDETKSEISDIKDNTSDKDKAIELVKKEWGEDASVYFTNEGESSGIYKVAVRDKSNTSVKLFYNVDLKNNTVEIDW